MSEQPTSDRKLTIADYEEVLADHRRLVRELDVLLNGEYGAAKQASLCDIVGQVEEIVRDAGHCVFSCQPWGLLPGFHDWYHGQCGRCGARSHEKLARSSA